MNTFERSARRVDGFQQRHTPTSFVFGVLKKFGDDNAGALVVQLTYAMFTTVFPLLLLLVTVLAIVLADDASARHAVLTSTFGQFPVVGTALASNIHVLKRASPFGLAVGLLGLLYGATGLAGAGLYAMEQVWNISGTERLNFAKRLLRSLLFLALLGVGLVVTTVLSGFGTFGSHEFWLGIVAEILAVAVNVGLYIGAFRILTPRQVASRRLIPGAVVAGVAWTVLQALGGYVVGHYLKGDNATYGTFGTVLGLLAWIYLGARVSVYAAELNTVLAGHLWPRAMVQPPLTKADQESISLQVIQNRRRPEQRVMTEVRGKPMTQDEYRDAGHEVDDAVIGTRKVAGEEEEVPPDGAPAVGAPAQRVEEGMATTHDSAELADTVRELAAKVDLGRIHDALSERSEQIQEKVGEVASHVSHAAGRAKDVAPDKAVAGAHAAASGVRSRPVVAASILLALIGLLVAWRRMSG